MPSKASVGAVAPCFAKDAITEEIVEETTSPIFRTGEDATFPISTLWATVPDVGTRGMRCLGASAAMP